VRHLIYCCVISFISIIIIIITITIIITKC